MLFELLILFFLHILNIINSIMKIFLFILTVVLKKYDAPQLFDVEFQIFAIQTLYFTPSLPRQIVLFSSNDIQTNKFMDQPQ